MILKDFEAYNPIVIFIYFAGVTVPAMLCQDPALLCISLGGALALRLTIKGAGCIKSVVRLSALPLLLGLANPLFNHNGATVLFLINDTPISLESALFGLTSGLMLMGILLWFASFSDIMTGDKLLYIFGALSPKLALIFSMTLRYIPLYRRQSKKVRQSQKALGLVKEENPLDRLRAGLRIFSVMVTWALENGVITADSMSARGYGCGRRTHFAIYRWRREDFLLLAAALLLSFTVAAGIAAGLLGWDYFPYISRPSGALRFPILFCYTALSLIPAALNIKEALLWKSLQSKA